MAEARGFHRRATFVLRVEQSAGRLRGHVIAVGTGEAGGWLEVRLPALAGARSQLRRTLRDVGRPA